jgi:hypothetical protein
MASGLIGQDADAGAELDEGREHGIAYVQLSRCTQIADKP